MALAADRRRRS